jgi:ATP-dependent 26S proteasome regulatory subunit
MDRYCSDRHALVEEQVAQTDKVTNARGASKAILGDMIVSIVIHDDRDSGAEIRSVCTEAGMFAIRARRKVATEKDFLEAVNKVIKGYAKFSATPRYLTHN